MGLFVRLHNIQGAWIIWVIGWGQMQDGSFISNLGQAFDMAHPDMGLR